MKKRTRELLLTIWLWLAVARVVFFSAHWAYMEFIENINEPPVILALSYGAMIESAFAVIVATIAAKD